MTKQELEQEIIKFKKIAEETLELLVAEKLLLVEALDKKELENLELQNTVEEAYAGMKCNVTKDWSPATIDIIIREAGDSNFLQEAKIIQLDGNIKVNRGSPLYIEAILREVDDPDMRYTLIEEKPRVAKVVDRVYFADGLAHVLYTDGSISGHIPEKPKKEEEPDDDDWGDNNEGDNLDG